MLGRAQEGTLTTQSEGAAGASAYSDRLARVSAPRGVQAYIHLGSASGGEHIAALGAKPDLVDEELVVVQAWIPINRVTAISQLSYVKRIAAPAYTFTRAGSVVTEGDGIHKSDGLRALGFDGAGVRVGVISDGFDNLASAQATRDLPAVEVVTSRGIGDEGTALLEIVHDLAPGATLGFCGPHTGGKGERGGSPP